MAPRPYEMHARADAASATGKRILDATIELYRERGVPGTTLKAVAEAADVSRGTILHHFHSSDGLLGAVLDRVLEALELPDPQALAGIDGLEARVRAFVHEMVDFQERSAQWWSMFQSQMQRPELQKREATYWARMGQLQATALGPELRDNPAANAALVSVIHPATVGTFMWAFEQAGLPRGDARPLLGDLAVDAVRRINDRLSGTGGAQ